MRQFEFRVGIPEVSGRFLIEAKDRNYKIMVSASRFWNRRKARFSRPGKRLEGLDVFLDSAGFTAMRHWGGYPWTTDEYLDLVSKGTWTYWSQMDLCCEPQVAKDTKEVRSRVEKTAALLRELSEKAAGRGVQLPLPVLQGWTSDDYKYSAELADRVLCGTWPDLVGVGSVCRRNVHGDAGIFAIVQQLDETLPPGVRLHLFGVKSQALAGLKENHRVFSADSMAWDLGVRWACRKSGERYTMDKRIEGMHRWVKKQEGILSGEVSELPKRQLTFQWG